jgi:hypothetical protein
VYWGFCREGEANWEACGVNRGFFYKREIASHTAGRRLFDASVIVPLGPEHARFKLLQVSVVCEELGRIFNNKGLNFSYHLDRPLLLKVLGEWLGSRVLEAYGSDIMRRLKEVCEKLEWRAGEIISWYGISEGELSPELRERVLREQPDLPASFHRDFAAPLMEVVLAEGLTGLLDPAHPDNARVVLIAARRAAPKTIRLLEGQ